MLPETVIWADQVMASGTCRAKRLVTYAGAEVAAANSAAVIGVARFDQAAGDYVAVGKVGKFEVLAGGAVDVGDYLASDNQGRVVLRTSTNPIVGRARTAATLAGQTILYEPALFPATA